MTIPLTWGWSWSGSAQIDRDVSDHPRSLAFTEVSASGSLVQTSYMRHGFDYNTGADSAAVADMYQLTLLDGAQTATSKEAIVTHVCGKDWAPGALALAASLRAAGTSRNLVLMVTDTVGRRYQKLFAAVFDKVYIEEPVKPHDSITRDGADCVTLQLRAWQLPYKKVLYMDADIIALKTHDPVLDNFGELSAQNRFWALRAIQRWHVCLGAFRREVSSSAPALEAGFRKERQQRRDSAVPELCFSTLRQGLDGRLLGRQDGRYLQ